MSQPIYGLTEETARRLRLMMGTRDGEGDAPLHRSRGRVATLVRCTSAAAAGGSGASAQCYPAVVLLDEADATGQTDGGPCWLTVWDDAGAADTPTAGRVYAAVMSGALDVGGDERQRAFAPTGGAGFTPTTESGGAAAYNPATTSFADTGYEITLPAAGLYLVCLSARGFVGMSAFGSGLGGGVRVRLYDETAGAVLAPSGSTQETVRDVAFTNTLNVDQYGSTQLVVPLAASGAKTIRVEAQRYDPSGSSGTFTAASIEWMYLHYVRLA